MLWLLLFTTDLYLIRKEVFDMTTTLELTTAQKIKLQEDMGVVADELLFSLASDVTGDDSFLKLSDDTFIVLGKTFTVSGGERL